MYIARTAAQLLNTPSLVDVNADKNLYIDENFGKFINQKACQAMQIITNGKSFKVIAGKVAEPPQGTMEVHFVKPEKDELSEDRISTQVIVSSLRQNTISSLHALLKLIYVPLII